MFRKAGFWTSDWRHGRLWWLLPVMLVVAGSLTFSLGAFPLYAHGGGVPRLTNEVAGPYRIFAWTQPEPLRVGDFHLSIAVVKGKVGDSQKAEGLDEPITDATVTVSLVSLSGASAPIVVPTALQEQLGSYYYEADATLPTVGDWRFTIEVSGAMGDGEASFFAEVLPVRQINWTLILAAGLLLLGLLVLMGLWNRLHTKDRPVVHHG